jgi:hypothetical protein
MPKQRNHQHHRQRGPLRAGGGLQLPQTRWGMKGPYTIYPEGWVTRPPRFQPLLLLYSGITAGMIVLSAAAALLIWLFGGR